MRRTFRLLAAGLLVAALASPAAASPGKQPEAATCGEYGTSVHFEKSPSDAAKRARKEEKLVLVLHISGHFENPDFTWNNAEALRVNALANPEVGKYLDKYFVSAFQKVGTFRIVNKNKQGGNVAAYFCAPDGRVLHVVAGPVDARTMLKEAEWVVETVKQGMKASKEDGASFKAFFRKAHADRLRSEHGLVVEPVTFDPPEAQDPTAALTFRDPTGRPVAPVLPPPPVDGPDVKFRGLAEAAMQKSGAAGGAAPGVALVRDRGGRGWALGNQGRVHHLMAAHSLGNIERLYGSVFEGILGERVSTRPVEVVHPFPWHARAQNDARR